MLGVTSVFSNVLRLVLSLHIWPVLESVPYALEKNVYSAALV